MGWVAKGTMTLAILPETGRQNITHVYEFMDGVNGVIILKWWLRWLPTGSQNYHGTTIDRKNLGQGWAATAKLFDHRSSLDHGHRASTMAAAGWGILLQILL